jgi:hypothetical protein
MAEATGYEDRVFVGLPDFLFVLDIHHHQLWEEGV